MCPSVPLNSDTDISLVVHVNISISCIKINKINSICIYRTVPDLCLQNDFNDWSRAAAISGSPNFLYALFSLFENEARNLNSLSTVFLWLSDRIIPRHEWCACAQCRWLLSQWALDSQSEAKWTGTWTDPLSWTKRNRRQKNQQDRWHIRRRNKQG